MVKYAQKLQSTSWFQCKGSVILLSFLWTIGLVCGLYFISSSGDYVTGLFACVSGSRQSVLGLLAVICVPLIISAISIYLPIPALVYVYAVIKAFSFGCCLCGIAITFGQSGWLVRLLLLFSDTCLVVMMLWLWCRMLYNNRFSVRKDLLFCIAASAVIGMIDYFLVSPYLAMLMNY